MGSTFMKILLCHNYYQQPGGEDEVFHDESQLLESYGHEVVRYTQSNASIARLRWWEPAVKTIWNRRAYRELRDLIRRERPQVMHCTNIFPLISPAAYYAARREGVAVVQSLHNYRLLCVNGQLRRNDHICEDCLGKRVLWPAIVHGCYRENRAASAVVATMLGIHSAAGTWVKSIHYYVALTEFSRRKYIEGGLPEDRIAVKPNFVQPDPRPGDGVGGYAVFVGRLSTEKGLDTLLRAWSLIPKPISLKIIGDGPLAPKVAQAAAADQRIEWLGRRPLPEALAIVGKAACLVMPSVWYETFGRTVIEAFAKGTPVLATRVGAMSELLEGGHAGEQFELGQAEDLASKVQVMLADPARLKRMRLAARSIYERKFTAKCNYPLLMGIYERARENHRREAA